MSELQESSEIVSATDAPTTEPLRQIIFSEGRHAVALITPAHHFDGAAMLKRLALPDVKAAIMLSGGAGNMDEALFAHLTQLFSRGVVRAAANIQAMFITGGTDTGVMQLLGRSVKERAYQIPLVGVVPEACCTYPNQTHVSQADSSPLEPNHSHFVLVQTEQWGVETDIMYCLADALLRQKQMSMVTLLVNGGQLSKLEVLHSVRLGIPVIVVEGSGRLADQIVDLIHEPPAFLEDAELAEILADGKLHIFSVTSSIDELERLIYQQLRGDSTLKTAWKQFAIYDYNATIHQKRFRKAQFLILVLGVVGTLLALSQSMLKNELNVLKVQYELDVDTALTLDNTLLAIEKKQIKQAKQVELAGLSEMELKVKLDILARENIKNIPDTERYFICLSNQICTMRILEQGLGFLILLIPILISLLLAATNRFNSGNKWLMLRAGAEAVKREIFIYRTFAGSYNSYQLGEAFNRESVLAKKLQTISHQLMQSDVNTTSLHDYTGTLPPQYSTAKRDDGMSILTPEYYLTFRLEDQLDYYLNKTNKTAKLAHILHWVSLSIGAIGTLLAALSLELWIALTTALVVALSSYIEQQQLETSLRKYNQASVELAALRNWWVALSAREQADQTNIDQLVEGSERVLQSEFSGWMEEMRDSIGKLREEQEKRLEENRERQRIQQQRKSEEANTRLQALKVASKAIESKPENDSGR